MDCNFLPFVVSLSMLTKSKFLSFYHIIALLQILIAVSSFTFVFIISGCEKENNNKGAHYSQYIRTGTSAVDFTAKSFDSKNISLSDFRGKVVLMTFWKKRCKECVKNLDTLEAIYKRFKSRGLVIIAINGDNTDYVPSHRIREFVKKKAYTFPVLFDDLFEITETYKITKIPITYLIDRKGIISYINYGEDDWMRPENIKRLENLL